MITFLVARLGRETSALTFGARDAEWLGQLTTGAWLIITPAIITGILLDTPMAWTLVSNIYDQETLKKTRSEIPIVLPMVSC